MEFGLLPRGVQVVAVVGETEGLIVGLNGDTVGFPDDEGDALGTDDIGATNGEALGIDEDVGATDGVILGLAVVISVRVEFRFTQYSVAPLESTTDICKLPFVNWKTWKYPNAPTLPALDPNPHAFVANFSPLGQATDEHGTSTGSHLSEAAPDPMWFTPPLTIWSMQWA